jgi:hypothetical protein
MRRPALLFVTLLAAWPVLAAAQGYGYPRERFEITPTIGYRMGGELSATDNDLFEVDVEIDESDVFGLTADLPIGVPGVQLELLARQQESTFQSDGGLFSPNIELVDVDISYYHVGLIWDWGPGQVNPFVAVAAGMARIDPDLPQVDAEFQFSGSLAGGVKIFFAPNFGVRLEGRGYWTVIDDEYGDDRGCCYHYRYNEDLYQLEATAGLIVAF